MTAVLVDSNVLLDLLTRDPLWLVWSREALTEAANTGTLVINTVIYGELSVHFSRKEDLDAAFPVDQYARENISYEAAFLAGKAFLHYRQRGGIRHSPLPDFFIGAHAAVAGYRLLTRDSGRYRTYFPKVELITPD
jgi:predicted nucleic acid-binding protein